MKYYRYRILKKLITLKSSCYPVFGLIEVDENYGYEDGKYFFGTLTYNRELTEEEKISHTLIESSGSKDVYYCKGRNVQSIKYTKNKKQEECQRKGKELSENKICLNTLSEIERQMNIRRADTTSTRCYVYFVSDGEFIKIGIAQNPISRLSELQTGNAKELKILFVIRYFDFVDARHIEKALHDKYCHYMVRGEWFNIKHLLLMSDFKDFDLKSDEFQLHKFNAQQNRMSKCVRKQGN